MPEHKELMVLTHCKDGCIANGWTQVILAESKDTFICPMCDTKAEVFVIDEYRHELQQIYAMMDNAWFWKQHTVGGVGVGVVSIQPYWC